MYISQDIAERIKNAAAQNNCKLGDMFAELGISANTLHNMKTSMPKTDTLAKIADYLNVSVDYLLGRETKNSTPDQIRSAIINRVYAMSDEQAEKLLDLLESLVSE
jgi:transcriptional regulator with XRE-family HTH domain